MRRSTRPGPCRARCRIFKHSAAFFRNNSVFFRRSSHTTLTTDIHRFLPHRTTTRLGFTATAKRPCHVAVLFANCFEQALNSGKFVLDGEQRLESRRLSSPDEDTPLFGGILRKNPKNGFSSSPRTVPSQNTRKNRRDRESRRRDAIFSHMKRTASGRTSAATSRSESQEERRGRVRSDSAPKIICSEKDMDYARQAIEHHRRRLKEGRRRQLLRRRRYHSGTAGAAEELPRAVPYLDYELSRKSADDLLRQRRG